MPLFFYLDFFSQPFTNHRTAGEGREHFLNSSLPLPPALQILRHYPGDYCRELTSEKLITNDQKCAEVFNNYFNSIVAELNIPIDQNLLNDASLFDDPIIAAIHKYERHPTSLKLRKNSKNITFFLFIMLTPIKC